MTRPDLERLQERARAGDTRALTQLGWRLLVGDGVAQAARQGVECVETAAARGEGQACALVAVFEAWGVLRAPNIVAALDRLQRAAELGWQPSQRELRLLAHAEGEDWAALRRRVDLAGWTTPPAVRLLRAAPRIRVCAGFATPEECTWLIDAARAGLRRALIYRKDVVGHVPSESRTNTESDYTIGRADVVQRLIRTRLAAAAGADPRCFEIAKLLCYQPGQHFSAHCDFQDPIMPGLAEEVRRHGQRVATALLYLNDDFEGGETDFPRIGLRHRGARGDLLMFDNVLPSGTPDYDTLHAGLPPTRGVKWVYSQWIRSRPVA
jgi:hypothetical protein